MPFAATSLSASGMWPPWLTVTVAPKAATDSGVPAPALDPVDQRLARQLRIGGERQALVRHAGGERDPRRARVRAIAERGRRGLVRVDDHGQRAAGLRRAVAGVVALDLHRDDGALADEDRLASERDGMAREPTRDDAGFVPVVDPLPGRELDVHRVRGRGDDRCVDEVADQQRIGHRARPHHGLARVLVHAIREAVEVRHELPVEPRPVAIRAHEARPVVAAPGIGVGVRGVRHHGLERAEVQAAVVHLLVGDRVAEVVVARELGERRGHVGRQGEQPRDRLLEAVEADRKVADVGGVGPAREAFGRRGGVAVLEGLCDDLPVIGGGRCHELVDLLKVLVRGAVVEVEAQQLAPEAVHGALILRRLVATAPEMQEAAHPSRERRSITWSPSFHEQQSGPWQVFSGLEWPLDQALPSNRYAEIGMSASAR